MGSCSKNYGILGSVSFMNLSRIEPTTVAIIIKHCPIAPQRPV